MWMCCAAIPPPCKALKGKKVIIGATAIELGDRFSVPNGRVIPGPQLQMLAAESILQGRVLRTASGVTDARRARLDRASDGGAVAPPVRRRAGRGPGRPCGRGRIGRHAACRPKLAIILDTSLWHLAIAAYLAAMALDEIDFRSLLGGVAERRFQQIAMSLGDGLVCADQNGLITVWNPGAVAIFGYQPDEMIGQPFDRICALARRRVRRRSRSSTAARGARGARRQGHGARGPPQERRGVSARSLLLRMAGRRRLPVWRGDARHLGPQARSGANTSTWPSTTR